MDGKQKAIDQEIDYVLIYGCVPSMQFVHILGCV